MTAHAYADFLKRKSTIDPMTGIAKPIAILDAAKPHQSDIVRWALRRGRAAIFAGTGLGKTLMELEWAKHVTEHTMKPVLILAPLAVSAQHVREASKFGLEAKIANDQSEVKYPVVVTNYQKLDRFDLSKFGGIVLDESSILKSTGGKYRTRLINECKQIPFRLAATATPAPNDFMELGNHAEFLGIMSQTDMLASFFTHDGSETQKWRLKGHAEDEFWKWMATWAVMLRKPSDLGYPDDGYDLPPLNQHQHNVSIEHIADADTGSLFPIEARTLGERLSARRNSIDERVDLAVSIIINDMWKNTKENKIEGCKQKCGSLNTKKTVEQKRQEILNMLQKSKPEKAERQKRTENTCDPTTGPTNTDGISGHPKSKLKSTQKNEKNTQQIQNTESASKSDPEAERQSNVETSCSGQSTTSHKANMKNCFADKMDVAQSATDQTTGSGSTSIIATNLDTFGDSCARHATQASGNSKTTQADLNEPSNTFEKPDQWVVWCHLNKEQDALEKAFGPLAISIHGSLREDQQTDRHMAWLRGDAPILICKPSMFGHGLNWQHCHNCLFVGLSDSFEQVFQAIRRFWRFGQTKPVNVHFIAAETEGAVVANIKRKEADAEKMAEAMVRHMSDLSAINVRGAARETPSYIPTESMTVPSWIGE